MQRLLDRRERPEGDQQLKSHAAQCSSCRRVLDVQQRLFEGLAAGPQQQQPFGSASRAVAAMHTPPSRGASAWLRPAAFAAAMGLMLLAPALPVLLPALRPGPPAGARTNAPRPADAARQTPAASAEPPRTVAVGRAPEPAGPARRWLLDRVARFAPRARDPSRPQDPPPLAQLQPVRDGLAPIAGSFSLAYGALRRTIPLRPGAGRPNLQEDADHRGHSPAPPPTGLDR